MDILFRREQTKTAIGKKVVFKLWAKIELSEEERSLVSKYSFASAPLIQAIQPGLVRAAFFIGMLAFLVVYLGLVLWIAPAIGWRVNWLTLLFIALLSGCAAGYWYFNEKRETIYVIDLMTGRFFACRSVIELARKEAYLENISAHLRQVLEGAKHWGGKTQIEVLPLDPEEAKRSLLRGPDFS